MTSRFVSRFPSAAPLRVLAVAALGAVLLAGCTAAQQSGPVETETGPVTTTTSTIVHTSAPVTMVETVTSVSTFTRTPTAVQPPPSTNEPEPVYGDCPYLSTYRVGKLTGQGQGTPQIIDVDPHPVCIFYRSGGDWAATVRIVQAATPEEAVAAVDQHVPPADSMPATNPPGWTGGVMSEGEQYEGATGRSVYAVSKGTIAVIAEENESRSVKARSLAVCAIFGAGLEEGPAPDYCGLDN